MSNSTRRRRRPCHVIPRTAPAGPLGAVSASCGAESAVILELATERKPVHGRAGETRPPGARRAATAPRRLGIGAPRCPHSSASAIGRLTCMGQTPGSRRVCVCPRRSPGGAKPRPTRRRRRDAGRDDHSRLQPRGASPGRLIYTSLTLTPELHWFGLRGKRQAEAEHARHRPSHSRGTTPERDGTARTGWLI